MISILITDYKQPSLTKTCIESIKLANYKDIEILVHDNTHNNIGLAASSNLLAQQARGEYLFFLNNDTFVAPDIFEELLESETNITGCRMFDYYARKELASGNAVDRFGCPAGLTGQVFYPDGAIFVRKDIFEDIGGFDEKLFLFGEDRDFCWRAWLAGYTVGINHHAVFYHNSHSVDDTNFFRRYHSEKNIIRMMLKNYTLKSLLTILPQYLFWSALELGLISINKPQALWKSYLPAYLWNARNLLDTFRERSKVIHRIPDNHIPFSRVIAKWYLLKTRGVPKWK